jgi:2-dehydropantoate 2-reductase
MGAGAIGRLLAGLLAKGDQDVVLITRRNAAAEEIQRRGIWISDGRQAEEARIEATTRIDTLKERDVVLLTVKSYDTAAVANLISPHLSVDGLLLTLQNGLGNVEAIRSAIPSFRLVAGSTTVGARLLSDNTVLRSGDGETIIGEPQRQPSAQTKKLAAILSSSGLLTTTTSNLKKTLWRKALINAGINPVTALLKLTNGELLKSKEGWLFASKAVQEGLEVAKAERLGFQTDLVEEMRIVAAQTADNRSSMLEDVENHRRTEIDSINGAIVRFGREHSIRTPINEFLWESIKSLEQSWEGNLVARIPVGG